MTAGQDTRAARGKGGRAARVQGSDAVCSIATASRTVNVRPRINPHTARRLWALLSSTPHATVNDLSRQLGVSRMTVQLGLHWLVDLGYVERQPRRHRSRRVLVPFVMMEVM